MVKTTLCLGLFISPWGDAHAQCRPADQLIEEQIRGSKKSGDRARERVPKWSKEAFNDKLRKVKCTLENRDELRKNSDVGKLISSWDKLKRKAHLFCTRPVLFLMSSRLGKPYHFKDLSSGKRILS
jgi:hypothetical protein